MSLQQGADSHPTNAQAAHSLVLLQHGAVAYSTHAQNFEHSQPQCTSHGGLNHVNPQALVPVAEGHEFEYKEKSERITMSELVVKGCVDKSVNPVHELESQYGDFKQIQDDLDEDSIEVFCHLATLNKGAKQKAHDMARHLNNLAKHTEKMRSTFMDASIAEVENNELRKSENLFVIQRLTKENSEIDTINKKINPFIDKMRKSMT